jgi:hypothetical protein
VRPCGDGARAAAGRAGSDGFGGRGTHGGRSGGAAGAGFGGTEVRRGELSGVVTRGDHGGGGEGVWLWVVCN